MFLRHRIEWGIVGLMLSLGSNGAMADAVAVVSAKSPVTGLSRDQVVDIFLGKASRFPNGEEAQPIDQSESSALREEFYTKFAGKSAAQMKAYWSKIIFTGRGQPPDDVPNSVEVKKLVAKNPHAIGYIDKTLVDGSVRVVSGQ